MQITYPELSIKDDEKKVLAFDDDTLDGVSEKDLERSLERTKSLKEAEYLDNEKNEKKDGKRCRLHLRENCCVKLQQQPKECCIKRIPCIQKLLSRSAAKAE